MPEAVEIILNQWSLWVQIALLMVFCAIFTLLDWRLKRRFIHTWRLAWSANALALSSVLVVLYWPFSSEDFGLRVFYQSYAFFKLAFAVFLVAAVSEIGVQSSKPILSSKRQVALFLLCHIFWLALGFDTLKTQVMVYFLVAVVLILNCIKLYPLIKKQNQWVIWVAVAVEGILFLHHGMVLVPALLGGAVPDYMTHISFIDAIYECVIGIACLTVVAQLMGKELKAANQLLVESRAQLSDLMNKDYLTGVWHKNYLPEFMKMQSKGACFISIKFINRDSITHDWGKQVSDMCLKRMAVVIEKNAGAVDGVFRVGEGEYLVVCPQKSKLDASVISENIARGLASDTQCGPIIKTQLSVSQYMSDG